MIPQRSDSMRDPIPALVRSMRSALSRKSLRKVWKVINVEFLARIACNKYNRASVRLAFTRALLNSLLRKTRREGVSCLGEKQDR